MFTKNRFLFFWYVLTGGLILVTILPGVGPIHDFVSGYDSNRWARFLAYAAVATIPVAGWRQRSNILLSLVPVFVSIGIESLHGYLPGLMARTGNIPADLFGVGAGILLGSNIRVMRTSTAKLEQSGSAPSRPTAN
jgi:hypothetical protein